jgi:DNA-binding CsgD family transcriptional regulator
VLWCGVLLTPPQSGRRTLDLGGTTQSYRQMLAGLEALYQAEVARGHRAADEHVRWAEASDALHEILPWEECYALWRQSQALLRTGPAHRDQGVDALRCSYSLAGQLQAQPLLAELEALARGARVPLADPGTTRTSHRQERDVGLTRRETEILGHIVAGRTYGEIARSLVLSEKTISSHVSHLLSKTGCANRVDLALWATRRQSTRGAEDEQSRS